MQSGRCSAKLPGGYCATNAHHDCRCRAILAIYAETCCAVVVRRSGPWSGRSRGRLTIRERADQLEKSSRLAIPRESDVTRSVNRADARQTTLSTLVRIDCKRAITGGNDLCDIKLRWKDRGAGSFRFCAAGTPYGRESAPLHESRSAIRPHLPGPDSIRSI